MSREFVLDNLEATRELAARLAPLLAQGDVVALYGELGTGKTEFARALLRAMGIKEDIPSPTYTLVQSYETGGLRVFHFDLYRLKSSAELDELGWEDALADGMTLVEWPEKAGGLLPPDRIDLHFTLDRDGVRRCRAEQSGTMRHRAFSL